MVWDLLIAFDFLRGYSLLYLLECGLAALEISTFGDNLLYMGSTCFRSIVLITLIIIFSYSKCYSC